jgi:ParB family transcriptional regulator, chromosome partitioning protein
MMLEDVDKMILFTNYIIENGLSVREAERDVKDFEEKPKKNVSRETKKRDSNLSDIEERFVQSIGAKVEIKGSQAKGRIEIHYFSKEELENIYKLIAAKRN